MLSCDRTVDIYIKFKNNVYNQLCRAATGQAGGQEAIHAAV